MSRTETQPGREEGVAVTNLTRTRQGLSSLQHLLYVGHHDPLDVLQLRVDAAQIPPRSAVDVRLLGFLDVSVCEGAASNQVALERKDKDDDYIP